MTLLLFHDFEHEKFSMDLKNLVHPEEPLAVATARMTRGSKVTTVSPEGAGEAACHHFFSVFLASSSSALVRSR